MTYQDNVQQAAVALKRGEDANWELAQLTHENTYMAGGSQGQAGRVSMEQWCTDVRATAGIAFLVRTGSRYKAVWERYGSVRRTDRPSWSDAYADLRGAETEYAIGGRVPTSITTAPPAAKREVFQQLAADPDVIQEAAEFGTPTSQAAFELLRRADAVRDRQREHLIETDPIARRIDEQGAALDMERACAQFARDCERFARDVTALSARTGAAREQHLFWVRQAIERAHSVLDQIKTYVETGRTDLDAFLQDVLGGATRE